MSQDNAEMDPQEPAGPAPQDETNSKDFQFVLKALVAAYEPLLEHELKAARNIDELNREAGIAPPGIGEDIARLNRVFETFFTAEVAIRLLPEAVRGRFGPAEEWRWCMQHIRCCMIFGWLVCRGPRTFRASSRYLYQYWICVRQALGTPVAVPPTADQRRDFDTLVKALATAYKPYLTGELKAVELLQGVAGQTAVRVSELDEGDEETAAIFDRLFTQETARALLGREVFSTHSKEPFFWFCRCWCLCAIRFGCCLARARRLVSVRWCLRYYWDCLRHCLQPLHCRITGPSGCIRGLSDIMAGKILEPVAGDAYGTDFGHYLIEVRDPANTLLTNVVIYPNGADNPDVTLTQGNFAIAGGTLGWIDVQKAAHDAGVILLTSTTFTVTLRVFGTNGGELQPPCTTTYSLSADEAYIKRISTPWSVNYPDPSEPLRVANNALSALATIGGWMHVRGDAFVYGCLGEQIQQYTIWAIPDQPFSFPQPPPYTPVVPGANWTQIAHIEYAAQTVDGTLYTADQVRAYNMLNGNPDPSILTNIWGTRAECISVAIDFIDDLICWNIPSLIPSEFNSNLLPKMNAADEGGTGKFTFLLQIIDTDGNQFYDVQRAWVDNEPVHAAITGIASLPPCADLYTQYHDGTFKTVNIQGTAWDRLIDPADPTKPTSDNFAHFTVNFQKQGAIGFALLIDSPNPVPARPLPLGVGTLTPWNLQTVDAATNPLGLPADQLLAPGQECTYVVILQVWDSTVVNEGTDHESGYILFPIKIINGPEPL
ncbi:MAG TPA: hypothetical protein VNY05_19010 [Candidatus Acidoferrales bacterium]|nr:hypothetical protein [Candidatus Acidoferrales bacterium]